MIKLKRLKISRYRNVAPCEIIFGDRWNLLLGPNGSGKTTLLNLISRVLRSNLGDTSDPFAIEVELSFPGGTLSGKIESYEEEKEKDRLASSKEPRSPRLGRMGAAYTKQVPRFEVQVRHDAPRSTVTFLRAAEKVTVIHDEHSSGAWPLGLFAEDSLLGTIETAAGSVSGISATPIRDQTQNTARLDESLDTFRSITEKREDAASATPELRPQIMGIMSTETAARTRVAVALTDGIVPPSLMRLTESRFDADKKDISFNEGELGFLGKTCRLLGLPAATAKLELTTKSTWSKETSASTFDFGNLKLWFTRKDGSIFQDQQLSYGQKRLLTFFYYLDANPSIVIADELVSGLHPAWIKECVEALGERQAFLTSQNPILFDHLAFESVEQVKEAFVLCRIEAEGEGERMVWRNPSDEEAALFYGAYRSGGGSVGDILRRLGLW